MGCGGRFAGVAGNTLWINTGCALSEQALSGPDGFDPATSSPCEAWFGMYEAGGQESGGDLGFGWDYLPTGLLGKY